MLVALQTTFQYIGISGPLTDASLKMGIAKPKPKLLGAGTGSRSASIGVPAEASRRPGFARTPLSDRASSFPSFSHPDNNRKQVRAACASRQSRPECGAGGPPRPTPALLRPLRWKEEGPAPVSCDPQASRGDAVPARKCQEHHSCLPQRAHSLL